MYTIHILLPNITVLILFYGQNFIITSKHLDNTNFKDFINISTKVDDH